MLPLNTKTKVVYRTFSLIQAIVWMILRIAWVLVGVVALYHYHANPVVTVIIALLSGIFFLVAGMDEMIVYTDALEFSNGFLINLSGKRFRIKNRKTIFNEKN